MLATGRSCRPASVAVSMLFVLRFCILRWLQATPLCPLQSKPNVLAETFATLTSVLEMAAATDNPIPSPSLDANTSSPLPQHTAHPVKARQRKNCVHGKFQPYCKECKGSGLCVHLRHKNRCAICKRFSMAIGSSATVTIVLP